MLPFDFLAFGKEIIFYLTCSTLFFFGKGFMIFAYFNKKKTEDFENLIILNLRNIEIQYLFVFSISLLICPETIIQLSDFR